MSHLPHTRIRKSGPPFSLLFHPFPFALCSYSDEFILLFFQTNSLFFRNVGDMPQTRTPTPLKIGFCGAEIFSIYVWGVNCEVLGLYVTIEVDDSLDPTPIYCRDSKDPQLFSDDKFVCIEKHSVFTNPQFDVFFSLKEPVGNLIISNGRISWNDVMLTVGTQWHGITNAFVLLFEAIMAMQLSITRYLIWLL